MPGVVYVVDDDASFRTAIGRRLVYADYEVRTYSSAAELLEEHPSENHAGCILLDVRMPTLSGPELQRRLGELGCTLPIVYLTAHEDVATTVQAIKAGAEDFLIKPIPSDELLRVIARAIKRHEATMAESQRLGAITNQMAKSRGDRSGTHAAELALWKAAGIDIPGADKDPWYREMGRGMGATLKLASAMNAYVLADRGTWLSFKNRGS